MNLLVTAGPTLEYLDPIRFLSNPSTGFLGYLIARKAAALGHKTVLVTGPTCLDAPEGVRVIRVVSALEMRDAVLACFPEADALVMTAAVSDWRPAVRCSEKLKRKIPWKLPLVPNPDILKDVARVKSSRQIVVGFALESEALLENGWRKLREKDLDVIVINTTSNFGEGGGKGPVYVLDRDGNIKDCTGFSKARIASLLLSRLQSAYPAGRKRTLRRER